MIPASAMGYLRGCAYAVSCDAQSCTDAAAFHAKFERVQKGRAGEIPVTLTADAALLLAKMKDADLAPLKPPRKMPVWTRPITTPPILCAMHSCKVRSGTDAELCTAV